MTNWSFFASSDGQRYLQSEELRMTLAILAGAKLEDALDAAFDESRGPWVFLRTFPHPDFLRRLVEKFVASEDPRNLRPILLISEKDMSEATSASFHLPQAYDTSFPCSQCTVYRSENETCLMFVEVFHFPNRNDPSVCATVSFRVDADHNSSCIATSDSRVEMYLSESCRPQRAPFARPSRKLFTQFDTLYRVLQEGNTDGLEKLQAVNQSWGAIIDRHKRALPRRKLLVNITLNGENPTVVTVVIARWNGNYEQVLRVLVPRSPEQLSRTLRKHLHDALVKLEFMYFERSFRHAPQDALLHWDQSKALVWTARLFQSLKRTQVQKVTVDSDLFGNDNLPALMRAARSSCRVGTFNLVNYAVDGGFTVRQVVDLLRDPASVASNELIVRTVWKLQKD